YWAGRRCCGTSLQCICARSAPLAFLAGPSSRQRLSIRCRTRALSNRTPSVLSSYSTAPNEAFQCPSAFSLLTEVSMYPAQPAIRKFSGTPARTLDQEISSLLSGFFRVKKQEPLDALYKLSSIAITNRKYRRKCLCKR